MNKNSLKSEFYAIIDALVNLKIQGEEDTEINDTERETIAYGQLSRNMDAAC